MLFDCYENVVYPGHGVARISRIIERKVAGVTTAFYELTFISKDVTVLVPTANSQQVGLRHLSSPECVEQVFTLLGGPAKKIEPSEFPASSWNKRNKNYQLKLRAGGLHELSEIYRDLKCIETHKALSFGEKNLLAQAEALLAEEISLIGKQDHQAVVEKLRMSYGHTMMSGAASLHERVV